MIDSGILEQLTPSPGVLSFGLGVLLTMLGLNRLDEMLGEEMKNMLPQLKIWWHEDIKSFLWWCVCKMWMPIIPAALGFLASVWVLINLHRVLGETAYGITLTIIGFAGTQIILGLGMGYIQQMVLNLLGVPDLFDTEEYERKSKESHEHDDFYDNNPNVG